MINTEDKEHHFPPLPLPDGIAVNYVDCPAANLNFHILESGYEPTNERPLLLLLHGYPELAFSWRKIMPKLAGVGYYVVAPDQRGYGRTTGWDCSEYEKVDMSRFTLTNLVRDLVVLVHALGYHEVACVIGHDFGAVSASMCAVMRPDIFRSVLIMSHPFKAMPSLPFNTAHQRQKSDSTASSLAGSDISKELAALSEPRKHYKWDCSKPSAASEWGNPPQGLSAFLRGYFYVKSASWPGDNPHPLGSWTALELAKMPHYYIMPLDASMPSAIHSMLANSPSTPESLEATKHWLPDADLDVYVNEWTRTGFQGGLNWYRAASSPALTRDLDIFANKKIEVPAKFVSGARDWGNYQQPGALEHMNDACTDFRGIVFINGAGHWPQQEQPERVLHEILRFLEELHSIPPN